MGRNVKFELEDDDVEDPVVWVEPEDSEEEETHDTDEGAPSTKGFEDALLGRLEVGSVDAKRISAAIRAIETQVRKEADSSGRINNNDLRKINVRDQLFDPVFYLANIHKKTSLDSLRQGVQQLQRAASSGGKVSRKTKDLVRYSFPKFVATQDALNRLLTELDGGGPGGPAVRLAELSETLEVSTHQAATRGPRGRTETPSASYPPPPPHPARLRGPPAARALLLRRPWTGSASASTPRWWSGTTA